MTHTQPSRLLFCGLIGLAFAGRAQEPARDPSRYWVTGGLVSTHFALLSESGGLNRSRDIHQVALSAGTERLLALPGGGNHINARVLLAPIHDGGKRFAYGFFGIGAQVTHQASAQWWRGWWELSLGLDLRREQYSGTNLILPAKTQGGEPTLVVDMSGRVTRPWALLSFSYCGLMVPFRTGARLEPITRFECSRPFLTPSSTGVNDLVLRSSEQTQVSLWVGARF